MDDIAAVIGHTATCILKVWFPGERVWVPRKVPEGEPHPIAKLIGRSAFAALMREFPGEYLCIPTERATQAMFVMRRVAERGSWGWSSERISRDLGISVRRVNQLRVQIARLGWDDYASGYRVSTSPENSGTGEGSGGSPGAAPGPTAAATAASSTRSGAPELSSSR